LNGFGSVRFGVVEHNDCLFADTQRKVVELLADKVAVDTLRGCLEMQGVVSGDEPEAVEPWS